MSGSGWFHLRSDVTYRRPESLLLEPGVEVCLDSEEILQPFFLCEPPEQVRLFITLFCLSVGFGLVVNHAGALQFYSSFVKMPQSERRGLGYTACKAYGFIPIPKLSHSQLQATVWLLVTSLLFACHPHLAPRFFLFASFLLYFLYFGNLYCESKHGGHGGLLLPSVLLLLVLSGGPQGSPWSLVFVKIFLGLVYLAGAVSKVVVSCIFGRRWAGSTMQAYIMDGMWSRPHRLSIVRSLQKFLLQKWYLCTFLALSGLIFEFGWLPLVLLGGRMGSVLAAAIAFSFHMGVDVLQGLDFLPFWCPVFWAFLPDLQSLWHGQELMPHQTWTAVLAQGFEEEPCRWLMSAMYVLLQFIVSVRLMDCREGKECLPLTCCPMFAVPRNLFDSEVRGGVMTDCNLRTGGSIDFAYNFFPWHSDLPLQLENLKALPGRTLFWMSTSHVHPKLVRLLQPEFDGKELLLMANFEISADLQTTLEELVKVLEEAKPEDWMNSEKVGQILDLQTTSQELFEGHRMEKAPAQNLKELHGLDLMAVTADLFSCLTSLAPTEQHPYVACD
mmetsp:Transcript_31605/g.57469  ORF Transcript_31605/g.57469 Transcript_31605/m.57469 type:complete len:556 (+) Transcript_31605:81-1748(+)